MQQSSSLLGQMTTAEFLQNYWQKKPCVLTQAVKSEFLSADEISGFALDDNVESRLIMGNTEDPEQTANLALEQGPFSIDKLSNLADQDWTLLIQSLDLWDESFHSMLNWVDFIPRWRLDDIMVSIAAAGGGVGPHRDQYDVFLIQSEGQRHWRVSAPNQEPDIVCNNGLLQVAPFAGEIDQVLTKGDVLYIPPGWRHWGVAKDLCVTISIGFRAPSAEELVLSLSDQLSAINTSRFSDPWRKPKTVEGITAIDIAEVRNKISNIIDNDDLIAEALGLKVTQTKIELEPFEESERTLINKQIEQNKDISFSLRPASRMSYFIDDDLLTLYVNGTTLDTQLNENSLAMIDLLIQHQTCKLNNADLNHKEHQKIKDLLTELADLDAIFME